MNLHENTTEFRELITLTAREKHIPESAVERDYYIVQALMFLSKSDNCARCVFKGGTSLSKCYPGSIERFSEDIDLTYIPENYDPTGAFDFASWKPEFTAAKDAYEHLHEELLYTDEKQLFDDAVRSFEEIDQILKSIGE